MNKTFLKIGMPDYKQRLGWKLNLSLVQCYVEHISQKKGGWEKILNIVLMNLINIQDNQFPKIQKPSGNWKATVLDILANNIHSKCTLEFLE